MSKNEQLLKKQKERFEKSAQWLGIPKEKWESLWNFIETTNDELLAEERKRIVKAVKKLKPKDTENRVATCNPHCHDSGRNEVVDEVLLITNAKE